MTAPPPPPYEPSWQPPYPPHWQPTHGPYPPHWQQPQGPPAAERGKARWIVLIAALITVLTAIGAFGYFTQTRKGGAEEQQIRAGVLRFAEAVDTDDQRQVLEMLCADEAEELMQLGTWDPYGSQSPEPSRRKSITVTAVTVQGDVAEAKFIRADPPRTGALYFRKEDNTWKVCDGAAKSFTDEK